jgi:hypothetical protein
MSGYNTEAGQKKLTLGKLGVCPCPEVCVVRNEMEGCEEG